MCVVVVVCVCVCVCVCVPQLARAEINRLHNRTARAAEVTRDEFVCVCDFCFGISQVHLVIIIVLLYQNLVHDCSLHCAIYSRRARAQTHCTHPEAPHTHAHTA